MTYICLRVPFYDFLTISLTAKMSPLLSAGLIGGVTQYLFRVAVAHLCLRWQASMYNNTEVEMAS